LSRFLEVADDGAVQMSVSNTKCPVAKTFYELNHCNNISAKN